MSDPAYPLVEAIKPHIITGEDQENPIVFVPPGFTAQSLEKYIGSSPPKYAQGRVSIHDIPSLITYLTAHHAEEFCLIYVDSTTSTITAILDDMDPGGELCSMGRRDHRAALVCEKDPAFKVWEKITSEPVTQKNFIRFIELNESHFEDPCGAAMRTLAASLELKKSTHFVNVEKMEGASRDVRLQYETETKQVGEIQFPSELWIRIPVYRHQEKGSLPVKVHHDLEDGQVQFTLRIPDVSAILDAAWERIFEQLTAAVAASGLDIPILKGVAPALPTRS